MWIIFVYCMVLYQLPKLSYEYHELEPFIDAETMKIHHTKHHQAYVDGLNKSLAQIGAESHPKYISAILSELTTIPESGRSAINFFGGGFENHRLFWETLIPNSDKIPEGKLEDIKKHLESKGIIKEDFVAAGVGQFGSGWCWLVKDTDDQLKITKTENGVNPLCLQKTPLLGLDMWEHAYYLKYKNKKSDYI